MTDRRHGAEIVGWRYCETQDSFVGKYHIADKNGRAYMCPCGSKLALQERIGASRRHPGGAYTNPFPRFNRYGFGRRQFFA